MVDEPNDPDKIVSIEQLQRQQAHDAFLARMKPARDAMNTLVSIRKAEVEHIATMFGLEPGEYNETVLYDLLNACMEFEEPPFKLHTDIGWLFRAYCLAMRYNVRQQSWVEAAAKVSADAYVEMDDLSRRSFDQMQALFSVPDTVHRELTAIVAGLSLFSDSREVDQSFRYICLIDAIIHASGLQTRPT